VKIFIVDPGEKHVSARAEAAKIVGVNLHYMSDVAFIKKHGSPEIVERLRAGSLGIQEALRMLGRTTQRDRNRRRRALTDALCEAVLNGEHGQAELLAAQLLCLSVRTWPQKKPRVFNKTAPNLTKPIRYATYSNSGKIS
jgi:hypothetical protein